ncbi:PE-PPE domain-containing protein [Mycolicibacterium brumae]|uniref:PE-PPE domain-containing protein n=1 Tax=Mycolicibacterium brumae TaxID=85968 RepID=A0A2G5PGC3_9MYCO|nr:PE-PPE domain-containing protein [Mycolicibacterium brumae]MCV7194424.1 PE-PPE domain-containing protein [Mycolicibacterium brumae]PIB77190.1 PE-PPE domain-containing protein [Mycolicibacterium brumae]RWA15425.1 hypothetical protein MBRU_10270 [Mycolicibacterium brumae DSM 44177]UWW10538.1 PE-PPE domain-containing protein [Mycolicibacterium brumae]
MGSVIRVFGFLGVVIGTMLAAAWSAVVAAVLPLAAVTALVMGGTGSPLMNIGPIGTPDDATDFYLGWTYNKYIKPSLAAGDTYQGSVAVYTPEEFWPLPDQKLTFDQSVKIGLTNLTGCVLGGATCVHNTTAGAAIRDLDDVTADRLVFGYSQSARIATNLKQSLVSLYNRVGWDDPANPVPDLQFVLIGNPNRPNGGILERFLGLHIPILDITTDGATPTDSGCGTPTGCRFDTTDYSYQYDGYSDFPLYPLNVLADLNALAGIFAVHGYYQDADIDALIDQGKYGDTQYYMIPTTRLPLLSIVEDAIPDPVGGWLSPVFTLLDSPLRAITEMGYDRGLSPGSPEPMKLIRFQPITDVLTFGNALAVGIDDALAEVTGDANFRPLGTKKPTSPYGVDTIRASDVFGSNAVTDFIDKTEDAINRFRLFGGGSGQQGAVPQNVVQLDDDQNVAPQNGEQGAVEQGEVLKMQKASVAKRSRSQIGEAPAADPAPTTAQPPAERPKSLRDWRKRGSRPGAEEADSGALAVAAGPRGKREKKAAVTESESAASQPSDRVEGPDPSDRKRRPAGLTKTSGADSGNPTRFSRDSAQRRGPNRGEQGAGAQKTADTGSAPAA